MENSGDPFATVTIIDRAKAYVFGVRDWFLQLVVEERAKWEAARTPFVERDAVPAPYADCPTCHAKESMREVAASVIRCQACGWQPRVTGPPGISRAQLENFSYPDAEHKRKFREGFGSARARILGRK